MNQAETVISENNAAPHQAAAIETRADFLKHNEDGLGDSKTQEIVRQPGWQKAGPGRPKGLKNKTTLAQREFATRVLGAVGTPEFDRFIAITREQLILGTISPAILTLILHYAYGKPRETIEVEGSVTVEKVVREIIHPQQQLDATKNKVIDVG